MPSATSPLQERFISFVTFVSFVSFVTFVSFVSFVSFVTFVSKLASPRHRIQAGLVIVVGGSSLRPVTSACTVRSGSRQAPRLGTSCATPSSVRVVRVVRDVRDVRVVRAIVSCVLPRYAQTQVYSLRHLIRLVIVSKLAS